MKFLICTCILLLQPGLLWAQENDFVLDSPKDPGTWTRNFGTVHRPYERMPRGEEDYHLIEGVSPFLWTHGCAPTSLSMLMGYYDNHGYPGLIANVDVDPDTFTAETPPDTYAYHEAYESIASQEHYNDYSLPNDEEGELQPDKSELGGAHVDNCVADFTKTSFSSEGCRYSSTMKSHFLQGTENYIQFYYPELEVSTTYGYVDTYNYVSAFDYLRTHIRQNQPVILTVDCFGIRKINHVVLAIGYIYNEDAGIRQYIAYNTWDNLLHVYDFIPAHYYGSSALTGYPFSIDLMDLVYPEPSVHRASVYWFHRNDNGSYFFTANEEEKDGLLNNPQFELQGVSHYVYNNPVIDNVVPVYRFFNNLGSHFYTANENERDAIVQNLSHIYRLEGIAFYALTESVGAAKPVYRFFQSATASHYFTISEEDKADRIANDPTMHYEGIAWYAFSN